MGNEGTLNKKSILIVDDNELSRQMLAVIVGLEYNVLEAENGQQALHMMLEYAGDIMAVLLDLEMPIMDGYTFMEKVKNYNVIKSVPIMVITASNDPISEEKALSLGATSFITKPFNTAIIQFRLRNVLENNQDNLLWQLQYLADYDRHTGIYSRSRFFKATNELLMEYANEAFTFIRLDINRLKQIHEFFGTEEGDRLIEFVATCVKEILKDEEHVTFGKMESDTFCICLSGTQEKCKAVASQIQTEVKKFSSDYEVISTIGICPIADKKIPLGKIYEMAGLVAATGGDDENAQDFVCFNDSLYEQIVTNQQIVKEFQQGLNEGQFEVYYQPKINLQTGELHSAEALVRWNHPEKGLILPDRFIPILEKNRLIPKLDYFVWEQVCKKLREWNRKGRKSIVSVNVSRVDLYEKEITTKILGLIQKYELKPEQLRLEITETVCTERAERLQQNVSKLHDLGFTILMDDFGSGYSSLSMLGQISIDILKIDKSFLNEAENSRGRQILEAVVEMAKKLGLYLTVEGVEKEEQADVARQLGCELAQGYYYAKPMPATEYEIFRTDLEKKCSN